MKRILFLLAIALALPLAAQNPVGAQDFTGQNCTSIMVGRLASTDGSVITSHTCDGRYRTWAQIEPAEDHEPGAMRPMLHGTMLTKFRGDTTGRWARFRRRRIPTPT